MRLGVITNRNLCSPWASTHFYIYRALRRLGIDAVHVAGKEIAAYHSKFSTRNKNRKRSGMQPTPFTPELTEAIRQDLERNSYDAVLGLHASTVLPALNFRCPLAYVTDATAELLNHYYPNRQELGHEKIEELHELEQQTINISDKIFVPTTWAAESVRNDYGCASDRVEVIEWGGNLDAIPDLTEKKRKKTTNELRFLFIGLDWERKGGDLAVETVELLQAEGIDATLTVVGAAIPRKNKSPHVRSVGMLNRANLEESAQLDQLFQEADFYIHPARAECYGHVLCEALGFGVPVLATQTGGISQCVLDGETGVLFQPDTTATEYVERIKALVADREALDEMRTNAVLDFRKRLNWDHWASCAQQVLQAIPSPTVASSQK